MLDKLLRIVQGREGAADAVLLDPETVERLLRSGAISKADARRVIASPDPMFYSAALNWIGDAESFTQRFPVRRSP